ncbi:MAG: neutral zinc metallopeptidase [Kibdelosporangium sp.]
MADEDESPRLADLPDSGWRSSRTAQEQQRDPGWPGPAPVSAVREPRRNSPFAIIGVLGLVIVIVLAMGAPGRFSTEVAGTPVAGPAVEAKPNAAAPQAPSASSAPNAPAKPRWQELTEANSLLTPGLPIAQITCKLPSFGKSAEQLTGYYQAMINCLDEAWRPLLAESDHEWESPDLNVEDNPTSACGTPSRQEAVAFYCPRDRGIFMPRNRVTESMGTNQGGHIMVLAHEYGHHVQAMSGINYGMGIRMTGMAEDSPEYLELTRRMELQADCFSGMFISAAGGRGSISKSLSNSASSAFRSSVADKTHGTVKHQIQWGNAGVKNNNTAACNTWVAPASEVS